ncbi:hypothetical protein D915_010226 [Fasciola hepatica]|uniref:Exostosin GT47 domain-containing protein n=1 Tax=Fasciola hepatica TaxID=6192 RepID=A0A4E0RW15_FASHE|nr:hypothetical protein D915_010226 [Fasciola hepatica]
MWTSNLTEMIRNCISVFIRHKKIFILLTLTFTLLFLGVNFLLVPLPSSSQASHISHTQFCTPAPLDRDQASLGHVWLSSSNLPFLVDELMRINVSVHNELVELDQRRRDLLTSVAAAQAQMEHVRSLLYEHSRRFMRLRATLHSYESALRDKKVHDSGKLHISWPLGRITNDENRSVSQATAQTEICTLDICLNWNPCPVTSFLRVCRPYSDPEISFSPWTSQLTQSAHFLGDCSDLPHQACLHVAFTVTEAHKCASGTTQSNPTSCLVILTEPSQIDTLLVGSGSNAQRLFLLAAPYFPRTDHFCPGFDLFLPVAFHQLKHGFGLNESGPLPTLLPGTRPNLLGFSAGRPPPSFVDEFESVLLELLRQFTTLSESNYRLFMYEAQSELLICWPSALRQVFNNHMFNEPEWFPCHDAVQILSQSTFGLVLHSKISAPSNVPASLGWNVQLMLSLATGAIPVLVGSSLLPFEEAIPSEMWSRTVLRIPRARVSELAAILESIPEHHLVEMRRQGQILYRRYFQGVKAQIDSLFLAISRRLGLPQPPAPAWTARPAFSQTAFSPPKYYQVSVQSTYQTDLDDFLGPVGPTQSSAHFRGNFTEPGGAAHLGLVALGAADRIVHPFWLYPSTPWDVPMPSDAAHSTEAKTSRGLRPINHTINLAGFEFNMNLGGMFPYEQFTRFTIVIES